MRSHFNLAFLATFDAMEECVDYELTPDAFAEMNEFRKQKELTNYKAIAPFTFQKTIYTFADIVSRIEETKEQLHIDWKQNVWPRDTYTLNRKNPMISLACPFPLMFMYPLAFSFAIAMADGRIQKAAANTAK